MAAWGYEFLSLEDKIRKFLPILLLFYRSFHVFLTITICIYLCFAGEVLFRFLLLVSSVIRLEYQTRQASCVKG